jgi:NADH:ubiquinone oxidoreductase subunit
MTYHRNSKINKMNLFHAIKEFGIKEIVRQIFYHKGVFMGGKFMGCDKMGNRYYEVQNLKFQRSGRLRYVEYANWNYDSSQIQPEWYFFLMK